MKYTTQVDGSLSKVTLQGDIDESFYVSMRELLPSLATKEVVFLCENVSNVNSIGVQQWTRFIRELPEQVSYSFADCGHVFISYASLIDGFLGKGRVQSVLVPFECEHCGHVAQEKRTVAQLPADGLSPISCPRCSGKAKAPDGYQDETEFLSDFAS